MWHMLDASSTTGSSSSTMLDTLPSAGVSWECISTEMGMCVPVVRLQS
jgi:hypothetical protein